MQEAVALPQQHAYTALHQHVAKHVMFPSDRMFIDFAE